MVFIVSGDWRLRSYLKAELKEKGIESVCLKEIGDLSGFRMGDESVLLIDCKDQDLKMLEKYIKRFKPERLILIDSPFEGHRGLKRPLTIGECLDEVLGRLK